MSWRPQQLHKRKNLFGFAVFQLLCFCFGFWIRGHERLLGGSGTRSASLGEAESAVALKKLAGGKLLVLRLRAVEALVLADRDIEALILGVPVQSNAVGASLILGKGDVPVELDALSSPELCAASLAGLNHLGALIKANQSLLLSLCVTRANGQLPLAPTLVQSEGAGELAEGKSRRVEGRHL